MTQVYPSLNSLSLWPHQKEAIEKVKEYISTYRTEAENKAALVQMPTGSGKSGVIAILSRCVPEIGMTLVLTPRRSLRNQLYRDVEKRFFDHIDYPTEELPKYIKIIREGKLLKLSDLKENMVIVMTIQMLVNLSTKNIGGIFDRLVEKTSLLLVDEGHYEPAYKWSKVIRRINAPKVIFTATPYRNDFKVFDIDPKYSYILSFQKGQANRYLRQVQVKDRPSSVRNSPDAFVNDVIDFYESTFPHPGENPPRVIIRCDDSASIRHLCLAFERRGKPVVGIHETFRNGGGECWERKHVPNPENEGAVFWIHQFKLLEGIDDKRFQILAIYEKINSARSLVQQVGRIIRNPAREAGSGGYLLDHWDGFHSQLWNGFLKYDEAINEQGSDVFDLATGQGILPKLIKLQPKVAYVEGRFRSQFEFSNISPESDIQLPLRVNLLQKNENFDIKKFVSNIIDGYEEKDRVAQIYEPAENLRVILSISCSGSPFLINHTFMEADLHITIIREFSDYICIYDSSGLNVIGRTDLGIGHSLDVNKLKRLFQQINGARLTTVSLNNSNLGTSTIRSRKITAASIEATIPGFDDYAQVCTTAEGYSCDNASSIIQNGSIRRYLGFSRGKITQNCPGYRSLREYLEWLNKLQHIIENSQPSLSVFTRYALEKKVPEQNAPRNILLDLEDVRESYVLATDKEKFIEIEDTCLKVEDGRFRVTANDIDIEVEIKFESGKYHLKSGDLESPYISIFDNFPRSIVKYLNRMQSFRVLPEDLTSVYVRGQFYNPAMKVGSDFDSGSYALGHCFVGDDKIGQSRSEKGTKAYYDRNSDDWDPDSLFGIISRLGRTTEVSDKFGDPNIVVCDDVGTEIADFILCDTGQPPRVVFIHAKASYGEANHYCSASALHEVCAQAVKNLGYLAMFNDHKPSKLNSWDNSWSAKVIGGRGIVLKRIRKADATDNSDTIWKKIRKAINNPMVDKEVWLFLGNILSKEYFENELSKVNPLPHIVQAAYLLHATMSDVASIGAKLRIFCKK